MNDLQGETLAGWFISIQVICLSGEASLYRYSFKWKLTDRSEKDDTSVSVAQLI